MKKDKIIYWVATSFVIIFVGIGSFADFLKIEPIKESFNHLGFPEYIIPFFGLAKLLGTFVILVPAAKRFKEAAYAGLVFYFIGATYCHLIIGDGADKYVVPLFILITITLSYIYSNKIIEYKNKK